MYHIKIKAAKVRAKSVKVDVVGGIITALVGAMIVFFGTPEFESLLGQWFSSNPVLGAAALVFINTVVTEAVKALSNAIAINSQEEFQGMSVDEITLV